jgi:hypothetical protein
MLFLVSTTYFWSLIYIGGVFDEKRQYCTYLGHLRQLNKNRNCLIGVLPYQVDKASRVLPVQGSLTEVEGSVQLTFLYQPV